MKRNYRELSGKEIEEIAALYPVTPNREIARQYNISVDALQDCLAHPRGWKKDYKALFIGSRGGKSLTERQVAWIIKHYHHTKNEDIMEKYGIGESTIHRVARKYGLKKSERQMKKTQRNAAEHAHETCRRYGLYEELSQRMKSKMQEMYERGERIPGSFKPGESNKDRLGKRRFQKCIEKGTASMRETRRKELMWIRWGLPQKTKLRLFLNPDMRRKKSQKRYFFKKHGYYVKYGEDTVYYDENTDRRPEIEARAHEYGIRVEILGG